MTEENKAISTGYPELDKRWGGGIIPGKRYLLGGRIAMGKTALAMNIASNIALAGHRVTYLPLQYPEQFQRLPERFEKLCTKDKNDPLRLALKEDRIHIMCSDDTQDSFFKKAKASDILIVDGFYEYYKHYGTNKNTIVALMPYFDYLADDGTILVTTQISTKCEARKDKRPCLSDFYKSCPTDNYSTVALLYRDEYYHKDSVAKGVAEIITVKNDADDTGTDYFKVDHKSWKFSSV